MKRFLKKMSLAIFLATAAAGVTLTDGLVTAALACDYYASPNGGGNGLSQSSPFRIANFWNVAAPGRTLCLMDGVYSDSISPPQNLNGTASARITVRALNDGKVLIDGGGVRNPVQLTNNDYFIFEGFNAHNAGSQQSGTGSVFRIGRGADNNIFRRICAWDGTENENGGPWGFDHNRGNLLEDVCAFGRGRKMFASSFGGGSITIRRAWARWERSVQVGPKMTYSLVYNSSDAIFENVIGTWDESAMRGIAVNQPYGILAMDRADTNSCVNSKYLGSIAYLRAEDEARNMLALVRTSNDTQCLTLKDIVAYIEPGTHQNLKPFSLLNSPGNDNKLLTNVIEIGGTSSLIQTQWQVTNRVDSPSLTTTPNIWTGTGARVCKRYVNGQLTNDALWPWPMNQRIIDAMRQAGKTPVDVTKTMEEIFGPIPSECRGSGSTPSSGAGSRPAAPVNLNIGTNG